MQENDLFENLNRYFVKSSKKLLNSKIHSFNWEKITDYNELQLEMQEQIRKEMLDEKKERYFEHYFYFDTISIDDLPASIYEVRFYQESHPIHEHQFDAIRIQQLEQVILSQGLQNFGSILVEMIQIDLFRVGGGNHRLQAFRNLIHQGLIRETKIPVLFFVPYQLVLMHDPDMVMKMLKSMRN